jgi:hypothetical protein
MLLCRPLPCRALPCRALPCRALTLIREYSKPLTRSDWRTFIRNITNPIYINEIDTLYTFERNCALFKLVHTNMHVNEPIDSFINYKYNVNKWVYKILYFECLYLLYFYKSFKLKDYDNPIDKYIFVSIYYFCNYIRWMLIFIIFHWI